MKKLNREMLMLLEKVSRNVVEREKGGQSFCQVFWHQPKRPKKDVK